MDQVRPQELRTDHRPPPQRRRLRAGNLFAFVRWAAGEHGTVISRIDIVRAIRRGEPFQTLPFARPSGDILLRLDGWPKVRRALAAIDAVEALSVDPADASPDHWRHVHICSLMA